MLRHVLGDDVEFVTSLDPSLALDGTNTVTLTSLDGDNDVSAVQSIQLQYMHTFAADSDWLQATAPSGSDVRISGFANSQVRVFDVSDPKNFFELNTKTTLESSSVSVTAAVPYSPNGEHTILAFAADTLPPGNSASGFFYFQAESQPQATIYLSGITEAGSGRALLYFEVPVK